VLDGGRLLFCGIEFLRRKPIDRRIEEGAYRISLAAVLVVVIYANISDLVKLSGSWFALK
jgi:membrane-associated protease RseP (regulator of RpoE activity)